MSSSSEEIAGPIANGPFALLPVRGTDRFGNCGKSTGEPLAVEVRGTDDEAPRDAECVPVPVRVLWEVIETPEGAEADLLSGRFRTQTTETTRAGRALVGLTLGATRGTYRVRASLPDVEDSGELYFDAYTDGVVSQIFLEPVEPKPVNRVTRVVVQPRDWLGNPVTDARIDAHLSVDGGQDTKGVLFTAEPISGGTRYVLKLRTTRAEVHQLNVGAARSGYDQLFEIGFLPGPPARVDLTEDVRRRDLGGTTVVHASVTDRFGNLIPDADVAWSARRGRAKPLEPPPGFTSSALVTVRGSRTVVSAEVGTRGGELIVRDPSVVMVGADADDFVHSGRLFNAWLLVETPPGGGILRSARVLLQEVWQVAERVSITQPTPENGIPPPEVRDLGDGLVELRYDDIDLALDDNGDELLFAELTYHCFTPEEACFDIVDATIVVATSPDEEKKLNPGLKLCPKQKALKKNVKKLCLNFCIAPPPTAGKTPDQVFNSLRDKAKGYVESTQKIFDKNIPVCCPKVVIEACYNRIKWEDYKKLAKLGDKPGFVEGTFGTPEADTDKDQFTIPADMKAFLKTCRKKNCVPVYLLPPMKYKSGSSYSPQNGEAITPVRFPETVKDSGVGVFLSQSKVTSSTLAHELGHLLLNLRSGEHVRGTTAKDKKRVMYGTGIEGRDVFIDEECSRIFDNIGDYGGTCK